VGWVVEYADDQKRHIFLSGRPRPGRDADVELRPLDSLTGQRNYGQHERDSADDESRENHGGRL